MNVPSSADWSAVTPIIIVAIAALVVLLVDLGARVNANRYVSIVLGSLGLIGAGVVCAHGYADNYASFGGSFILGGFSVVFQEIILVAALGSLVLFGSVGKPKRIAGAVALMLWSTCGAMLMAGAGSLMTIFLGLELLSLALYCLCALADRPTARESALKYLILSSTASGFLLYGMALLFGASGSVTLAALVNVASAGGPLFWLGTGMFFIGLAFKLSLVPFHTWSPDVYEGAPLPVTAYMSVVTKAAALAVLARYIYAVVPIGSAHTLLLPIWVIAAISMIVGNVGMLAQHDLKRLLAYSGIAQVGYILTGMAGVSALGLRYAIYYLVAYLLMNLGAFAVASVLSADDGEEGTHLANYHGLARRHSFAAVAMTFFLLALAGMPPTGGFLGKILILASSVNAGYAWLGGVLVLGTAISLFAYGKIIRAMYEAPVHAHPRDPKPFAPLAWASTAICLILIIAMTFYPITPSNILPLVK